MFARAAENDLTKEELLHKTQMCFPKNSGVSFGVFIPFKITVLIIK